MIGVYVLNEGKYSFGNIINVFLINHIVLIHVLVLCKYDD